MKQLPAVEAWYLDMGRSNLSINEWNNGWRGLKCAKPTLEAAELVCKTFQGKLKCAIFSLTEIFFFFFVAHHNHKLLAVLFSLNTATSQNISRAHKAPMWQGKFLHQSPAFWSQWSYERVTGNSTATVMSAIEFCNYFCFLTLMQPMVTCKVLLWGLMHKLRAAPEEHKAPSPWATKGWLQLCQIFWLERQIQLFQFYSFSQWRFLFSHVCHTDHEKNISENSKIRTATFSETLNTGMNFQLVIC